MDKTDLIIGLEDLSFAYPGGPPILDCLNFSLEKGEKAGLVGPNGSGKTTFLHIIMGILKATSGTVRIFGESVETEKDFAEIRPRMGFLFQNPDDQLFSPTVLEDVAFGPLNLGKNPAEARRMSEDMLKKLGLRGFEDRITYKLSGGEKKLVALATVLVMEPDVLLLDEPTTALDESTRERIVGILNGLGIGYLIVSHEYEFLAATTQTVYGMRDGRIVSEGAEVPHSHFHWHPIEKNRHEHA